MKTESTAYRKHVPNGQWALTIAGFINKFMEIQFLVFPSKQVKV